MLDKISFVNIFKRVQELEKAEKEITNGFKKIMYDSTDISFDLYKEIILDTIQVAMGDIDKDISTFIYATNWGRIVDSKSLKEYGLECVKNYEDLYDYLVAKKQNRKVFVIADTHFNHKNIINYCDRPYKNIFEMNSDIIKRWNEVVNPNDIVFHLGDVGLGTEIELKTILKRLNGKKYLIMGNHDHKMGIKFYEEIGFEQVYKKDFVFDNIILSHYPKIIADNQINIYGHIHNAKPSKEFDDSKHFCVSLEKINYAPIELNKLFQVSKDEY